MKLIPQTVTRSFGRQLLQLRKQSPHILFASGLAGVLGGTVMACKSTLKLGPVLDEMKEDIEAVKAMHADDSYPMDDQKKDLAHAYLVGSMNIIKLYGPAVVIGGAGVAALTSSHVILNRRNAALTAAYAAVTEAYESYRARVRAKVGEEVERDLYLGLTDQQMEIDGVKTDVKVFDPNQLSPYARFFDEFNEHWQKNPEYNKLYILCQQNYANHLLHSRGHIFLNEVYDMLGFERTTAGQVVGWVIGMEGDNYIDFGMYDTHNAEFINGYERSILLDFNVDGVIYDRL